MSASVVWLIVFASAGLLAGGGYFAAQARLRSLALARRRQVQELQAQLDGKSADPFGELQVLGDQLNRISQRLARAEDSAGLPATAPASGSAPPPPAPAASTPEGGSAVSTELEADLELFRREVYTTTQRIDGLVSEKQHLAEKIVELETELEASRRATQTQGVAQKGPKESDDSLPIVTVLQQEADDLRAQLAERDKRIETLVKGDATGLVHELERIRQELTRRNEELAIFDVKLNRAANRAQQLESQAAALEQEKEAIAAKALETASQLRQANEQLHAMQQAPGAHPGGPSQVQSPMPTAPLPAPHYPALPTPPPSPTAVPPPRRSAPPRTPPPLARPQTSQGPPPRGRIAEPRRPSGIFPLPRTHEDDE